MSERMHAQCIYETGAASRLRAAKCRAERMLLYGEIGVEYVRLFPEHLPTDGSAEKRTTRFGLDFVRRFVKPNMVVAEVGPGRCELAFLLAPLVRKIYGVDVLKDYIGDDRPPNFELRLTDGIHMPFEDNSIDLAISNQLMEHLHPDDAADQLSEVYRVLKPGCGYCCITPSRINGPHDSSSWFEDLPCPVSNGSYVATGLHLKEYTTREIIQLFRRTGFRRTTCYIGARGFYLPIPSVFLSWIESIIQMIPAEKRKRRRLLGMILGNRVFATK